MSARGERLLTAKQVTAATAPGRYADGGGLYLAVSEGGRRRWVWQFQWHGKTREMGLGSATNVTLKEAREERDRWRSIRKAGRDPITEREASRLAAAPVPTFGEMVDQFLEAKDGEWSNAKHAQQWRRTLDGYAKPLYRLPVSQVGTPDILGVLKPIWQKIPETASRVRGRVETVIDFARAQGHVDQHTANPARWRGHLAMILPKRQKLSRGHHPAVPYEDIPKFMGNLRRQSGVAAMALELTVLTVARTSETLLAQKTEFDLERKLWTVPAKRMKGKREHRVPLTDPAVEIIETAMRLSDGPYLFPGLKRGRPLSNMAMEMVLRRMGIEDATVHGMRSSFRDWAGDETHFPREVIEAALAHVVGDKAEQAYRRSDALEKRRKLMEAWASYCSAAPAGNVVKLARPDASA